MDFKCKIQEKTMKKPAQMAWKSKVLKKLSWFITKRERCVSSVTLILQKTKIKTCVSSVKNVFNR